ncbi:OmpA family protein [Desulfococcaceae bacterium HSG9]|nr:OmpA family protein [Desulfococcaceae bacterium HSG9]
MTEDEKRSEVNIVLNPFFDADSGEVPEVSRDIEKIFYEVANDKFPNFKFGRLRANNLANAHYIIDGKIRYERIKLSDNDFTPKFYYHVFAGLTDLRQNKIKMGNADIWIDDQTLDYTPSAIYRDSPMYLRDQSLESSLKIIESPANTSADIQYLKFLKTKALLIDAGTAYENRDYKKSLEFFQRAAQRDDGQVMKTYAGLYMTNYMLKRFPEAEDAFGKLVAISVEKTSSLTVKFLFGVNDVGFLKDKKLRKQYKIWLKKIGEYFKQTSKCLEIIGHCSNTGPVKWNNKLSFNRAKRIQQLINKNFPQIKKHSKAIGKGFYETIIGSGTDDEKDALDRRVEFKVVPCQ